MKKDILIDFLDDHIELKTSFDELKDQIIIPSVKRQKKSTPWFKILIPALTCLFVVVLSIGIGFHLNGDSNGKIPPDDSDDSISPEGTSFSGLTPYQGEAQRLLRKQYESSLTSKKQTIYNFLDGDKVIYELSYGNELNPDSYIVVYMPTENYDVLTNKEMDGSIINDLISKNSSLAALKWFTSTTKRSIEVVQSSYHLVAIYAVGKVEIINSNQETLNQLSYLKPLNIPSGSQKVQLEEMNINLPNYWFMVPTSTDVTAWNGYVEDYVTSSMMIAEIQNSVVNFNNYEPSMDCSNAASMDFLNYLDVYHIESTKYNYEGLLKYIENYKEGKGQ